MTERLPDQEEVELPPDDGERLTELMADQKRAEPLPDREEEEKPLTAWVSALFDHRIPSEEETQACEATVAGNKSESRDCRRVHRQEEQWMVAA